MGQNFGTAKGPVVFGWLFAARQLGAGLAALGSGVTRDPVPRGRIVALRDTRPASR